MYERRALRNKVSLGVDLLISFCCLLLINVLMSGCAIFQVKSRSFPGFVAVIAQSGDTLSSLASKYLDDPSKGWLIAEFNDIDYLHPGQEVVIPLKPYERRGLTKKGYQTVPVLVYHNFSKIKASKTTITQVVFEEQMKLLKEKGYRVITLDQLFDFLEFESQIPKKSVVITIDDGWRSTYDIAFPILKKYSYPATLFVYTDFIGVSKKSLSWEIIREMADNGIDIQCHTKTHRNLVRMDKGESFKEYFEAINKELTLSARKIKEKLNKDVKYLSYPYGDTNHLVIAVLKKHGYRGAFTVERGSNPFFISNYRINRSVIYGDFDLKQFEKNLNVFDDKALMTEI